MNLTRYLSRLTIERYRRNKRSGLERTRASGESVLTAVSRDVYLLSAAVAQLLYGEKCSHKRVARHAALPLSGHRGRCDARSCARICITLRMILSKHMVTEDSV